LKTTDAADAEGEEATAATFYHWDFSYYSYPTKVQTHSFDEKKFSKYSSLERSLAGMISTFSKLFGLDFCKISAEDFSVFGPDHVMTWQPDVIVFSVWEDAANGGDFLGYLYLDLFLRDHEYNHAGHYNLRPVSYLLEKFLGRKPNPLTRYKDLSLV
jgi:metallopeptidase MepB